MSKDKPIVIFAFSGGNALGPFVAGAFEGLTKAGIKPDIVCGTSTGAICALLVAGNPPDRRLPALHRFWTQVSTGDGPFLVPSRGPARLAANRFALLQARLLGRPGLYRPMGAPKADEWPIPALYDLSPLARTLEDLADFDYLGRGPRLTVHCTDIQTGEEVIFDSAAGKIKPEHIVASCSLMPDFPPRQVDGRWLADGGFVANLPLRMAWQAPPGSTLFAIDLFTLPDWPYMSPDALVGLGQDLFFSTQSRHAVEALRRERPDIRLHTITHRRRDEDIAQHSFEFSAHSVAARWQQGLHAAETLVQSLAPAG
ncbi:patatin-like phospholipase family protein [Telmatospirillum sp. J64-1]|uniref:patatin-like phospholipase family protein n=1 Tax=Telmatospirillum sp. J64-1 TaxID=2502183 RepID=UPI00115E3B01|nr:patatin-like phospholipase family protein [Telmatospirillum sp. J64-1]